MRASTHAQAREAAQRAADALARVEAGKRAAAVPRQEDRFARTAREAKAGGWTRTRGPRE